MSHIQIYNQKAFLQPKEEPSQDILELNIL